MNKVRSRLRKLNGRLILVALLASLALTSSVAQSARAQILSPQKKDKSAANPRFRDLRPGEVLDIRIDPNDSTKNRVGIMRPNKLIFADCISRGRNKGMWLLDAKGDTLQHVSSRGGRASWASDRIRMVCIDPRLHLKILALDKPGKGVVLKTPEFLVPEMPAWSPAADVIAFGAKDKFEVRQIFVVDAVEEATGLKQLTHDTISSYMPTWTPDGSTIVFSRHQGKKGLYAVPVTGGPVKPFFVSDSTFLTEIIWSPDGKYLVGTNRADGNIYRLDADGSHPFNLTKIGTRQNNFGNARFMDNGKMIIFGGKLMGRKNPTLFTTSIEGGEPKEFRVRDALNFMYASPNW